ncbi:a8f7ec70-6b96-4368-9f81-7338ec256c43-CDS [Sclerotinia trifoliorum]|uniref:A8f7ec70-6b96-4368-9f81-7338ec256c43-CDS n=1 Tax=Sclerotinia trifoliorum TaxID=28548 RepID=A0A8H2VZ62_9HELO|nr:a8f7ec70-6b96-4368-9f81-7338ec256c43-CDS [Sclerotinia trifoliorum]
MHNLLIPKRGLNTREVIALFMMVCAQLIIGGIVLQIMLANLGIDINTDIDIDTGMGVADIFSFIKEPFNQTLYTANMHNEDGDYTIGDGSKADGEKVREEDFRIMMNAWMGLDGKITEGQNKITSTFLFNVGEIIGDRITSHREFVLERKDSLSCVLWDIIQVVYEIEEVVAMAGFGGDVDADTGAGTSTTNTGEETPHHQLQNKHMAPEQNIWQVTTHQEGKPTAVHKIAKEKMEQGDIEGVLKMISETLRGFESLLTQKLREDLNGTSGEGKEKIQAEIHKMVEEKKRMVYRGVVVFGEMQREMVEIEGWIEGMRDFLVGVCGEVLGGDR